MNPVEPSIGSRLRILGIISGCMILVESPNPLITKEAHQYKKADIDPAGSPYYRGRLGAHAYLCTVLF